MVSSPVLVEDPMVQIGNTALVCDRGFGEQKQKSEHKGHPEKIIPKPPRGGPREQGEEGVRRKEAGNLPPPPVDGGGIIPPEEGTTHGEE